MSDPQRAARLWLAVAVATLGLLSVGALAEETSPAGDTARTPRPWRAGFPTAADMGRLNGAPLHFFAGAFRLPISSS